MPRCAPRLTIPSRTSQLARVRARVACWAEQAGLPERAAQALQLAVDEACANAIEHGYGGRPDGRVEVEVAFKPDALTVTVRHRGDPYDPERYRPPELKQKVQGHRVHGYGLHLMHRLVDEIAFRLRDGASEVCLTKRRNGRAKA
jgi:anti-sigma regulatory factor (Ser/Thr protein kinase)